ncbi:transglutaminase family protein [Polluticaenibacter yanchengensis]|uniref:Transglutaminase family protein n=1 Tax=Polluticaenibacter yanchengensis TaxID=3014562 RepID=A0ABT4UKN8_9BACT|nr:transglutaminase family protein [Chitinophagaceae bacterium LY-5]
MQYKIVHKTNYQYESPASFSQNILKLIPRETSLQQQISSTISIFPEADVVNDYKDYFGNKTTYFAIQDEIDFLDITVTSYVTKNVAVISPPEGCHISWEQALLALSTNTAANIEAKQYVPATSLTAYNAAIHAYAFESFTPGRSLYSATEELMYRIFRDFKFQAGFTTVTTPAIEIIQNKTGVCQDFAHFAIACLRAFGLPARYISGYIETIPPPGMPKLIGVDASHAWFAVYIPNAGWFEFDPTNNQVPNKQHIVVGWGRDYLDIAPLKGVLHSLGHHHLNVSVDVQSSDIS